MTGPIAHAGHWLVNVAYMAPLLVLGGVVAWGKLKDRRDGHRGTRSPEDGIV